MERVWRHGLRPIRALPKCDADREATAGGTGAGRAAAVADDRATADWGWRILFAMGAIAARVALYLRRTLSETSTAESRGRKEAGSFAGRNQHKGASMTVMAFTVGWSLIFQTFTTYTKQAICAICPDVGPRCCHTRCAVASESRGGGSTSVERRHGVAVIELGPDANTVLKKIPSSRNLPGPQYLPAAPTRSPRVRGDANSS